MGEGAAATLGCDGGLESGDVGGVARTIAAGRARRGDGGEQQEHDPDGTTDRTHHNLLGRRFRAMFAPYAGGVKPKANLL
jgi:hypothetical protein